MCAAYDKETRMLKAKLDAPMDLMQYPGPGKATEEQQIKLTLAIKAVRRAGGPSVQ